jgi:hypothetical protein
LEREAGYVDKKIHKSPAESNFCDECRIIKKLPFEHYSPHMSSINKEERMANSYSLR